MMAMTRDIAKVVIMTSIDEEGGEEYRGAKIFLMT